MWTSRRLSVAGFAGLLVVAAFLWAGSNERSASLFIPPLRVENVAAWQQRRLQFEDVAVAVLTSNRTVYEAIAAYNTWMTRSRAASAELVGSTVWTSFPNKVHWYPWTLPYNTSQPIVLPPVKYIAVENEDVFKARGATYALYYLAQARPLAKWYMITNPSVFVVLPNLVASLENVDESQPWIIGRSLPDSLLKPRMPGPGVLLSRPALLQLLPEIKNCLGEWPDKLADDFLLRCARTVDSSIQTAHLAGQYVGRATDITNDLRKYHPEGLVPFPISFMNIEPQDMYTYDYFLFQFKTHGPTDRADHRWSPCPDFM